MTQSPASHLPVIRPASGVEHPRPWPAWLLAAVEVLVAGNAVAGGWLLISTGFGLPTEWLSALPVDSWTWPGIALIGTVAVPQMLGAVTIATVAGGRPDVGYRLGVVVGGALVLWIAVQLLLLQRFFFLQPVVAGLGLLEIGLAWWWRRLVTRKR